MKPTIPPINTPDGRFDDGDPVAERLGTVVTALHMNNVQDATRSLQNEVIEVLKEAGITADANINTQLRDAIKKIVTNGAVSVPDASLTQKGIVQLNNTVTSTSTTQAGTANAVKTAYDKGVEAVTIANGKAPVTHTHTYSQITGVPMASTTVAGITTLNDTVISTSTTQAGTANAVKMAYDKAVEALNKANTGSGLGVGQTWEKVSRTGGVTYTNNTGKPIAISVRVTDLPYAYDGGLSLIVDSKEIATFGVDEIPTVNYATVFGIIPSGSTYRINILPGTKVETWELR